MPTPWQPVSSPPAAGFYRQLTAVQVLRQQLAACPPSLAVELQELQVLEAEARSAAVAAGQHQEEAARLRSALEDMERR
ncbi:hypothetical protein HaLaN_28901, partial [Haematococcus lacustris]